MARNDFHLLSKEAALLPAAQRCDTEMLLSLILAASSDREKQHRPTQKLRFTPLMQSPSGEPLWAAPTQPTEGQHSVTAPSPPLPTLTVHAELFTTTSISLSVTSQRFPL